LASLGGLTALKKLSPRGCRGDHREHERKVWKAIAKRLADAPKA
jgi:hypothetical protein